MKIEVDMPEHHYNNIMSIDSVCLGRAPYKGIIMYAINAIKHGRVLDQEPQTFKWCTDCREYDQEKHCCHRWSKVIRDTAEEMKQGQEPKTGHWKVVSDGYGDNAYICECSECKDTVWVYKDADRKWNYCPNCGAKMVEPGK